MVVGKKTKLSKKTKHHQPHLQQHLQQHHQSHHHQQHHHQSHAHPTHVQHPPAQQSSSSSEVLKDEVPLTQPVSGQLSAIELGYNSGDEYDRAAAGNWSAKEIEEVEKRFEKKMRKKGFIIKKMAEDGACLFRAVADQLYGDQEMHQCVRKLCMDYMAKNADYFSHYVTEDFTEYIQRKRMNNCHGNHVEIQALSEMFNRPIEVYHYNCEPINILPGCKPDADTVPIRLSYHQNVHYNSVVDPYKATIGVGLGLPAFKPGSADRTLLEKAMRISEEQELEKVMLEDKMKMTDWEATNEAIEEQIARESYVQWLRDNERRLSKNKKLKFTATATATTTTTTSTAVSSCSTSTDENFKNTSPRTSPRQSPKQPSPRLSPKAGSSGLNSSSSICDSFGIMESSSFVNQFPPQMFGINDWDNEDGDILRQVLAQSQQEYLDTLKRKARDSSPYSERASTSRAGLEASCSFKQKPDFKESEQVCKKFKSAEKGQDVKGHQQKPTEISSVQNNVKTSEKEEAQCSQLPTQPSKTTN